MGCVFTKLGMDLDGRMHLLDFFPRLPLHDVFFSAVFAVPEFLFGNCPLPPPPSPPNLKKNNGLSLKQIWLFLQARR